MLRKIGIIAVLSLMALALAAVPALAQNPHIVVPGTATEDQAAGTVTVSGFKVAGLGSEEIRVELTATGVAQVECTNPGGNVTPGQDTTVDAAAEPLTLLPDRRGNVTLPSITTAPAPDPDPAVVCPSDKWDANIVSVDFSTATLSIF